MVPQQDSLRELGRSVAQLHFKLARIQEGLGTVPEGGGSAPAEGELDTLLDLVDAVESAIERRPVARARRWFESKKDTAGDVWNGLAIASAAARERLRRGGIEPAPVEGSFDPELHHVIEVVATPAGCEKGSLALTHCRGWLRRKGKAREVLRTAQVSVYGEVQ